MKCKTLKSTYLHKMTQMTSKIPFLSFGPNINFSDDGFYDSFTKVEDCRKIRSKRGGLLGNEDKEKVTRLSFSYIPAAYADCGKHVRTETELWPFFEL